MPLTIGPDDYCPFLTCLKTGAHEHPVCEECGAVSYGSLGCPKCQEKRPAIDAEIQRDLAAWRSGRS